MLDLFCLYFALVIATDFHRSTRDDFPMRVERVEGHTYDEWHQMLCGTSQS